MDLGLIGKRSLVMSSSRGIGLGVAKMLADEGALVMLTGRDGTTLEAGVADIATRGGSARAVMADLATPHGLQAIASAIDRELGGIDILVCNTGGPPPRIAMDVSPEDWRAQMDAMVVPITEIVRHVLPGMRKRKWGRIITVASSGVVQPIPNLALSNALRAAVVGWSKSLATDVAADGVTVNVVLPGRIRTARVDEIDASAAAKSGRSLEAVAQASHNSIPAGRYGDVGEFASVVTFLASQLASYVTGSMIRCDGGAIRSI
jgi:3-oxoacyl-[acyl-carrier protein] reductase